MTYRHPGIMSGLHCVKHIVSSVCVLSSVYRGDRAVELCSLTTRSCSTEDSNA